MAGTMFQLKAFGWGTWPQRRPRGQNHGTCNWPQSKASNCIELSKLLLSQVTSESWAFWAFAISGFGGLFHGLFWSAWSRAKQQSQPKFVLEEGVLSSEERNGCLAESTATFHRLSRDCFVSQSHVYMLHTLLTIGRWCSAFKVARLQGVLPRNSRSAKDSSHHTSHVCWAFEWKLTPWSQRGPSLDQGSICSTYLSEYWEGTK